MRRGSAPVRAPMPATTPTPPETITPTRTNTIPKLSERATGRITYQVGLGESGALYLAVKANEGGGYFSPEWVALARVRACLADYLGTGEAFATPLLRGAYVNRSVNNGGFLAAILRHEGLIGPAEKPHLHRCTGDWDAWEGEPEGRGRPRWRPDRAVEPEAAAPSVEAGILEDAAGAPGLLPGAGRGQGAPARAAQGAGTDPAAGVIRPCKRLSRPAPSLESTIPAKPFFPHRSGGLMLLPLSPFRRALTQFCGLPVAIPILLELSLALLRSRASART